MVKEFDKKFFPETAKNVIKFMVIKQMAFLRYINVTIETILNI
jgi:hypothetical protein